MKRNILFFITSFFFLSLSLKAEIYQDPILDSLSTISSDSLKVLSKTYRYSNPETAKIYAETLFKRGKKNNNLSDLAYGYHQLGLVDDILGKYDESIKKFNKGIEVSKSINDSILLIDLYLVRGNAYLYKKEYERVHDNYYAAIEIAKKVNNIPYMIACNANIAYLKKELGLLDEVLQIEKENLKISENIDFLNSTTSANLTLNLSKTYLALQKNDSAIFYSKKALGKSLLANNIEGTSHIYQTLGLAYYNKKQYTRSINNLEEAITIIKPFKNEQLLSELFFYKGRSLFKLNKIDEAIASLKVSEEILIKKDTINKSSILLADTYKLNAEIYKSINEHKISGDYFQKYIELNREKNQSKIQAIQGLYKNNLEDKNEIITKLSSKQKALQNKKVISVIIYILVFLIIISTIFFITKKSKQNKKNSLTTINTPKRSTKAIKRIDSDKAKNILISLEILESKEFFLNENFSLATVAKKLKTNPSYISRTVNLYKNQTFQEYANTLRIDYVIDRLQKDKKFRSYSVQHIAKEVGYKSPNSFTKHFKNKTGSYPSSFITAINSLQINTP